MKQMQMIKITNKNYNNKVHVNLRMAYYKITKRS